MDGITEPIILVLGHPIAGNPAQFVFERTLRTMDLPFRVVSCDVQRERLDKAIEGADVLGMRGLLLDRNLVDTTRPFADLYFRGEDADGFHAENALTVWLEAQIEDHFRDHDGPVGPLLWIGTIDPSFPAGMADRKTQSPIAWASAESIENARLIGLSETVDFDSWPDGNQETLVIDFANPCNDVQPLRDRGYSVINRDQARIGMLKICLQQWTGHSPDDEVMIDAIEEYLAI